MVDALYNPQLSTLGLSILLDSCFVLLVAVLFILRGYSTHSPNYTPIALSSDIVVRVFVER